jgi:hypothetical protein
LVSLFISVCLLSSVNCEYIPGIEKYISTNVARLSPVQWAAYWPDPGDVERDKTNGRLRRIAFNALEGGKNHSLKMFAALYLHIARFCFEITVHVVQIIVEWKCMLCRWTDCFWTERIAEYIFERIAEFKVSWISKYLLGTNGGLSNELFVQPSMEPSTLFNGSFLS